MYQVLQIQFPTCQRPDLSSASARHDTDEAKERSLSGHSEKKAVAVALSMTSQTSQNEPISITKNLRVCGKLRRLRLGIRLMCAERILISSCCVCVNSRIDESHLQLRSNKYQGMGFAIENLLVFDDICCIEACWPLAPIVGKCRKLMPGPLFTNDNPYEINTSAT